MLTVTHGNKNHINEIKISTKDSSKQNHKYQQLII